MPSARPQTPIPAPGPDLVRKLALLLALYTGLRLLFVGVHADVYLPHGPADLLRSFVHGLRFDLAAIALSNIPVVLMALAPAGLRGQTGYRRALKGTFLSVNTFLAAVMVADLEYSSFTGSRITLELLHLDAEAGPRLAVLAAGHLPLVLLVAAIAIVLYRLYPDTADIRRRSGAQEKTGEAARTPPLTTPVPLLRAAFGRLVLIALVVVAARGGLQDKVLEPIHAFHSADQELGLLTLNSAFTLIKSPLQPELPRLEFFPTDDDVTDLLRSPPGYRSVGPGPEGTSIPRPRQNVVILIVESFGTEFWGAANDGRGLTPFLDSLAAEGTFLRNNFANGRRSIEALPAVLLGVPGLMSNPLAKSSFQGNEWVGLGHRMEAAGYHTSFFHGARRGTMYFDVIARMAGMRDYHPLERYPADLRGEDFDGHWGLFDEPFLHYAVEEMGRHPRPFFSTIFTISTHHPFVLPEGYEDPLPSGDPPIHSSVRYVDASLRAFFAAASREEWFPHTLFIITGDHTQSDPGPDYDTLLGRYMVPLLLYHPGERLPPIDPDRISHHADLLHTVLDYVGAYEGAPMPLFGRSVFSSAPGEAVLQGNGVHWLVRGDGVIQRDPAGKESFFRFERHLTRPEPVDLPPEVEAELSQRLQAHMQHFNNRLLANSFYRNDEEGPAPLPSRHPSPAPSTGSPGHLL